MKKVRLFVIVAVHVTLLLGGPASGAPPQLAPKVGGFRPLGTQAFEFARRLDAGEFNLWQSNSGSFGFDVQNGGPGLLYPKRAGHSMMFAAGLWLGARVSGVPRLAVAEYSQEFAPGRIVGGFPENPLDPELTVYKVARFTGVPADTAHLERTPAELAADPTLDPLIHHSWSEYVQGAGSRGAPVRIYRLPNLATPTPFDSVNVPGPDVQGDQMTWCLFNDADPTWHANSAGGTLPMGVEVRCSQHTFATPGILGSTAYLDYEIVNRGSETLSDFVVSLWSDPDLGNFTDDLVGTDIPLGMVYAYNRDATDPGFGTRPPALGMMLLGGPVFSTNRFTNGTDPFTATESYNRMLGLDANGLPVVDPTTGLSTRFAYGGDPVAGTGWRDTSGSDKRMMLGTSPLTLAPGASTHVRAALIVARGSDRLSSVALLKRYADFVRDRDLGADRLPKSDLVILHREMPAVVQGCEPTPVAFRAVNFGPDLGPFQLALYSAPTGGGVLSALVEVTLPGLASGSALDTSLTIVLGDTQSATEISLLLQLDAFGSNYDIDTRNNFAVLSASHAVPHLISLAELSTSPTAQARVRFAHSSRDSVVSLSPVTQYEIYRRAEGPGLFAARAAAVRQAREAGMLSDEAILSAGWDYLGAVPAHGTPTYSAVVPLLPEVPSASGYQAFLVRAATATPTLFFDSCIDSIAQIDSLPPPVPANLRVTTISPAGDVQLAWDGVSAVDLRFYRVHRGSSPSFVPGPGNQFATPTGNSCVDPAAAPGSAVPYYKVAAVDFVGNRSEYALSGSGIVDVPGRDSPGRFELAMPTPNPGTDDQLFRFTLPAAGRVRLTIYDISGRLVRQPLRDAPFAAGRAEWLWDGRDTRGGKTAPGVYLVRLEAGTFSATRRVLRME
jgi:hypothetical protein